MSGQAGVQAPGRARLDWADDETLSQVRPAVREVLQASEGFAKLPAHEQQALAREMVKVSAYMANPDGLAAEELSPGGGVLATTQADATEDLKQRLAGAPGSTGADFRAGAVREGVQQFGELVKKVDFPKFVSGLIQGVFKAIVDSTIEQMHAYGELLANVAKTVDQFAQDNISENNGRDWLAERFLDQLGVDTSPMSGGLADEDAPPVVTPR